MSQSVWGQACTARVDNGFTELFEHISNTQITAALTSINQALTNNASPQTIQTAYDQAIKSLNPEQVQQIESELQNTTVNVNISVVGYPSESFPAEQSLWNFMANSPEYYLSNTPNVTHTRDDKQAANLNGSQTSALAYPS